MIIRMKRLVPGLYRLTCDDCGVVTLGLGWSRAIARSWAHDEECGVQITRRLRAAEVSRVEEVARELRELDDQACAAVLRGSAILRILAEMAAGDWYVDPSEHDAPAGGEEHRDGCPGCLLLVRAVRWGQQ